MSAINPYQDIETRRQYKNLTQTQKRNVSEMKEGVVVNSLIKQSNSGLKDMYDSLIIPDIIQSPDNFEKIEKENEEKHKKNMHKSLIPLLGMTTAIFAIMAGAMALLKSAAKHKAVLPEWKTLPEIPKNVAINNEPHFVTYLMIRDPNMRNVLGALGVFVLSAIGLAGKNFVDGIKEIWVRKKQADVQRDLQEKLIEVETRSFSGKMQILRNILSEKAAQLDSIMNKENFGNENTTFKKFISFKHQSEYKEKDNSSKNKLLSYIAVGSVSALITGLGFAAFRNVQKTAGIYEKYAASMELKIKELIDNQKDWSCEQLDKVKKICVSMNFSAPKIKNILKDAKNLPKGFVEEVIKETEKVTQEGAEAIAGKPGTKPSLYSHTNDDRAHLYNMIVNWENPLLKILFAGLSTVTAVGYAGTAAIEGIKEVQVIKENAKTELDLQNRLVNVELNNFESKKRSVIEPMIEEFRIQKMNGKDRNELKTRAENILYEIKNGPPFVYS